MFSFLKNKSFLKKTAFLTFALFLSAGLMFTSCKTDDDSGDLNGTWSYTAIPEYAYDIIINTSAKTVEYTGSYEGTIANSPNYTAGSGVLIIRFTKYASYGAGPPSTTHANVGKYGALYWTELKANSIKAADAYDQSTYAHVMFNTLAEAQAAFEPAADKVGTYVSWAGIAPLTKK
jgi:hypothetical protein